LPWPQGVALAPGRCPGPRALPWPRGVALGPGRCPGLVWSALSGPGPDAQEQRGPYCDGVQNLGIRPEGAVAGSSPARSAGSRIRPPEPTSGEPHPTARTHVGGAASDHPNPRRGNRIRPSEPTSAEAHTRYRTPEPSVAQSTQAPTFRKQARSAHETPTRALCTSSKCTRNTDSRTLHLLQV